MINKLVRTLKEFEKTAYHHYGQNKLSLLKFISHSLFSINTFILISPDFNEEFPSHNLEQDYQVITPTHEELEKLRQGLNLPREFYYDKIHGVKRCYLVLYRGEIAYIHWVYFKDNPSRFFILSEGVAELNYNTTLPKFRGKGLMWKLMVYISKDLKEQGYKKVVGAFDKKNIATIKSAERARWKEIGRVRSFGPFNRKVKV